MKKSTIIIQCLLPLSLFAQQKSSSSFDANAGFYADAYDVVWTMPQNMTDLDTTVNIMMAKGYRIVNIYGPMLESNNQECMLMYQKLFDKPPFDFTTTNNLLRGRISGELKTVYGHNKNDKLIKFPRHMYKPGELKTVVYGRKKKDEHFGSVPEKEFRFDDYVTTVSGNKARRWFNADTVFIYTLPVDDPYKEGYVYCTGAVITKKDRVGMALKMYFTDSGKKKESRYLRSLRKKIWYRNDEWKYDADIVKRAVQKYYGADTSGE